MIGSESLKNGAPGRIRTPNLLIRSQALCPVELRALLWSALPARLLRGVLRLIIGCDSVAKRRIAAAPYLA
jgi:hypothetical protein